MKIDIMQLHIIGVVQDHYLSRSGHKWKFETVEH
jgi:hypothetical protein